MSINSQKIMRKEPMLRLVVDNTKRINQPAEIQTGKPEIIKAMRCIMDVRDLVGLIYTPGRYNNIPDLVNGFESHGMTRTKLHKYVMQRLEELEKTVCVL